MNMTLLRGWEEPIAKIPATFAAPAKRRIPKSTSYFAQQISFVADAQAAVEMIQLAQERPLSHIGIDTEFQFARPGVPIDKDHFADDPSSVGPLLLSLALVEQRQEGQTMMYRFVVDLRIREVVDSLKKLLRLPVCFVGHFLGAELICLWALGLQEPDRIWDTWVAEKAAYLGLHNARYKLPQGANELEEADAKAAAEEEAEIRYDLVSTCRRHGVEYPFSGDKRRLQASFLDHPEGKAFSAEQIEYAAADAEAAARLYIPQVAKAAETGALQHLIDIEMPWTCVNARIKWNGVRIDSQLQQQVRETCDRRLPIVEQQLAAHGISNFKSHKQLFEFFKMRGLLEPFKRGQDYSFDKDQLKARRHLHPAVELIYEARRLQSLKTDKILWPELVGQDGRVHPDHRQLGADSGRQSCRWPNVLGLDRTLRPLIIPELGCGIGEVDLSQIEVGISAAVYGDDQLVEMFNSGDVYSGMAQIFYADELDPADRELPGRVFKKKHSKLRDTMKICTLGIIYGVTPYGLAIQLATPKERAAELQARFMGMFPALAAALEAAWQGGSARGYAVTATGLRRYRGSDGHPSTWEKNWLRNHPVQGSAAGVFKAAGIRLDKLYQQFGAKIILPVHDAYVFEAPLPVLKEVAELTEKVMCQAVQEAFPQLRPRADVNISHPECWNKEGQADALDKWLAVPAVVVTAKETEAATETPMLAEVAA